MDQGFLRCDFAQGLCTFFMTALCFSKSSQNTPVSETKEFRKTYRWISESKDDFKVACIPVSCYRGAVVTPQWKDIDTRKSLTLRL